MNVLLVEDELLVRTGMKTLVDWESNDFYLAAEASNGKEALELMRQMQIDIVITDIRMPIMDGLTFIEQIREWEYPCDIVVLSSYDDFEYVKKAMQLGVQDFIHKPTMEPDEIFQTLNNIARNRERRIHSEGSGLFFCVVRFKNSWMEVKEGRSDPEEKLMNKFHKLYGEMYGKSLFYCRKGSDWILLAPPGEVRDMLDGLEHLRKQIGVMMTWEATEAPYSMQHMDQVHRELSGRIDARTQDWESKRQYSAYIEQALAHIHDHYMDNLSLDSVSSRVHISPAYFSRLFQKETGVSFVDYVTRYRLEQAMLLLDLTSLPTYKIAERVGYGSVKYFNKLFKQSMGLSPRDYRNRTKS